DDVTVPQGQRIEAADVDHMPWIQQSGHGGTFVEECRNAIDDLALNLIREPFPRQRGKPERGGWHNDSSLREYRRARPTHSCQTGRTLAELQDLNDFLSKWRYAVASFNQS